jgi:atypical dual specificity phosphatase
MTTVLTNMANYVSDKAYNMTPQQVLDTLECVYGYVYEWRKYNYFVSSLSSKYIMSKFWNVQWWHNITSNIILGAIPLHNANHMELLKQENVGAVLSLLEDFEMTPTLYLCPVSCSDWLNNNIQFMQIKVPDSYGVSLDDIKKCISYLCENIKNNKKCYIHCKAGRGRSASIVLCYLLHNIYETEGIITKDDVQKTYEHLTNIRNEVGINNTQFEPIYAYVEYLNKKL